MPAQPLLCAPALVDEVVTVIDQQLQLLQPPLAGTRMVEARLSQRSPRDGEGVDWIGLAASPPSATLRRHPASMKLLGDWNWYLPSWFEGCRELPSRPSPSRFRKHLQSRPEVTLAASVALTLTRGVCL
jgi:hypothetical protein